MRRDDVLQFVLASAQTPDIQGVTAQVVADALGIWRNDAAVELNKLVAEGKLRREGKKNVRFFPISAEETQKPAAEEPAAQDVPAETQAEAGVGSDPKQYRAFSGLVGADGSLKYQLRVAMAAVAYPPNGLNMLITGSTGNGKSHFARTIWEYAKETGARCAARMDRFPLWNSTVRNTRIIRSCCCPICSVTKRARLRARWRTSRGL